MGSKPLGKETAFVSTKRGFLPQPPTIPKNPTKGSAPGPRAGLRYFNARWYDPETGSFISEDPIRDGNNWYVYCGNNPLTFTDPTGLVIKVAYFSLANQLYFIQVASYLSSSKTASSIMSSLNNSSQVFKLNINLGAGVADGDQYNSNKKELNWDPKSTIMTRRDGIISSSRALIHEMAHAWTDTENGLNSFAKFKELNKEKIEKLGLSDEQLREEFATAIEGMVGKELNEGSARKNYKDVKTEVLVPNVTTHKADQNE